MKRVTIIGLTGSGKTTFARQLSLRMNVPYLQIDELWFGAGGDKLGHGDGQGKDRVREAIRKKVVEFIQQDAWVSDGFYSRVQPIIATRADVLIYLDIPLRKRLANLSLRIFQKQRHHGLKRRDDVKHLMRVFRTKSKMKTRINHLVKQHPDKLVVLRSRKAIQAYLVTAI